MNILRNFSRNTQRYLGALLVFLFVACTQTPTPDTTQSNILVSDEDGNTLTAQAAPVNGLKGDYFDNMDFTGKTVTRYDATINANWAKNAPVAGIANSTYSVRWTGQIQPQYSQEYTFYLTSSGGARLMVNGQVLVNNWTDHVSKVDTGKVNLQANVKYDIRLEFYRNTANPGVIKLEWQSASRTRQVVPQARLFTSGSNTQAALNIILQNSLFQAENIAIDANTALTTIQNGNIGLRFYSTDNKFRFAAFISNNTLEYLLSYSTDGILKNILTSRQAYLGNLNGYFDVNGNPRPTESKVISEKVLSVIGSYDFPTSNTSTSQNGQLRPQFFEVGAFYCSSCYSQYQELVQRALILAGAGFAAPKDLVSGALAILAATLDWESAKTNYDDCVSRNCPAQLSAYINPVKTRALVNTTAEAKFTFQASATGANLYWEVSTSIGSLEIPLHIDWSRGEKCTLSVTQGYVCLLPSTTGPRGVLLSGQSQSVKLVFPCPATPSIHRGEITLGHSSNSSWTLTKVPVEIECYGEAEARASTAPMSDRINTPATFDTKNITITNIGTANLVISSISPFAQTSGPTDATITVDQTLPPAIAPNSVGYDIKLTGNCGSTIGQVGGIVTIKSNAINGINIVNGISENRIFVSLDCTGEARITASASPMSAPINTPSVPGKIIVENPGTADLVISSNGTFTRSPDSTLTDTQASITVSQTPPPPIAPGGTGEIGLTGSCGSVSGTLEGTVTISSNAASSPTTVQVSLKCTGTVVRTIIFGSIDQWGGCAAWDGVTVSSRSTVTIYVGTTAEFNKNGVETTNVFFGPHLFEFAGCPDFTRNFLTTQRGDEKYYLNPSTIRAAANHWEGLANPRYKLVNPRFDRDYWGSPGYYAEVLDLGN
jgi:hypothetical protein